MKKRSNEQSKYRWTVVVPMLREHWAEQGFHYSANQVNFMMKIATNCYLEEITTPWGVTLKRELPTGKGTPQMFEEWMDQVRTWSYEKFDLDIPVPGAIDIKYYEDQDDNK